MSVLHYSWTVCGPIFVYLVLSVQSISSKYILQCILFWLLLWCVSVLSSVCFTVGASTSVAMAGSGWRSFLQIQIIRMILIFLFSVISVICLMVMVSDEVSIMHCILWCGCTTFVHHHIEFTRRMFPKSGLLKFPVLWAQELEQNEHKVY